MTIKNTTEYERFIHMENALEDAYETLDIARWSDDLKIKDKHLERIKKLKEKMYLARQKFDRQRLKEHRLLTA